MKALLQKGPNCVRVKKTSSDVKLQGLAAMGGAGKTAAPMGKGGGQD